MTTPKKSTLQGTWCHVRPTVLFRAGMGTEPTDIMDLPIKNCLEFQCSRLDDDIEYCYYIAEYVNTKKTTAHNVGSTNYDIGALIGIGDQYKGNDFYDGTLWDYKMTPTGDLQGWAREVKDPEHAIYQSLEELHFNTLAGVTTLKRQGDIKPKFEERFAAVEKVMKNELLVHSQRPHSEVPHS